MYYANNLISVLPFDLNMTNTRIFTCAETSKPSLDEMKDNLLRSPYYFEKYLIGGGGFLQSFCINSPTQ
jgi:hypothetical protein